MFFFKKDIFIYERKEMILFFLIFLVLLIFMFTMGLHCGKKLYHSSSLDSEVFPILSQKESFPSHRVFQEHKTSIQYQIEHFLSHHLSLAVKESGLKLDSVPDITLPENLLHPSSGKTQMDFLKKKWVLSLGPFPNKKTAEEFLKKQGLQTTLLSSYFKNNQEISEIKRKYFIFLDSFLWKEEAEETEKEIKKKFPFFSFFIYQTE